MFSILNLFLRHCERPGSKCYLTDGSCDIYERRSSFYSIIAERAYHNIHAIMHAQPTNQDPSMRLAQKNENGKGGRKNLHRPAERPGSGRRTEEKQGNWRLPISRNWNLPSFPWPLRLLERSIPFGL